jgi:hypothetical protein
MQPNSTVERSNDDMTLHRILAGATSVIVCAFALGIAGFTGTVQAAEANPVALAEQAAENYWGNTPCAGQITIAWQQSTPAPAQPGTEVEAWVTFQTPDGPLDFGAAPATYTQCIVYISTTTWPTYASTVQAYPQFCQMMVHEFGHFRGYADSMSYQPSDIRYPLLTDANLPAVCMYDLPLSSSSQSNGLPSLPGTTGRGSTADLSRVRTRCFEVGCSMPRSRSKPRQR